MEFFFARPVFHSLAAKFFSHFDVDNSPFVAHETLAIPFHLQIYSVRLEHDIETKRLHSIIICQISYHFIFFCSRWLWMIFRHFRTSTPTLLIPNPSNRLTNAEIFQPIHSDEFSSVHRSRFSFAHEKYINEKSTNLSAPHQQSTLSRLLWGDTMKSVFIITIYWYIHSKFQRMIWIVVHCFFFARVLPASSWYWFHSIFTFLPLAHPSPEYYLYLNRFPFGPANSVRLSLYICTHIQLNYNCYPTYTYFRFVHWPNVVRRIFYARIRAIHTHVQHQHSLRVAV